MIVLLAVYKQAENCAFVTILKLSRNRGTLSSNKLMAAICLYKFTRNSENSISVLQKARCFSITTILMNAVWATSLFRRVRKIMKTFVMSVRPPVRMEQLGSNWQYFHEIW
jgi:hypothetical protein